MIIFGFVIAALVRFNMTISFKVTNNEDFHKIVNLKHNPGLTTDKHFEIKADSDFPPKNVVSYSLYGGANPRYTDGAVANADLMSSIYPRWEMRVYHDNSVPKAVLGNLRTRHYVKLVDMQNSPLKNPMVWRFLVASDPTVERYVVRDIDSRLSKREKAAVDEWIESGKRFHVMRDHPSHSNYAMSGGMWGGTRNAIPDMEARLTRRALIPSYLQDMNFLNEEIWPIAQRSVVQHDSFSCDKFGGGRPFPTPRDGWEHVGSVYVGGKMRQVDVDILEKAVAVPSCMGGSKVFFIPPVPNVLYVMNVPDGTPCHHPNNLSPIVCVSTTPSNDPNIIHVDVKDDWNTLGQRMLMALPQIMTFPAKWYFKVDPDTSVWAERLEQRLETLPPHVQYVGQVYTLKGSANYASGGAGYGIRRSALHGFEPSQCRLIPNLSTNYEDATVGDCLQRHGVTVHQLDGLYGDTMPWEDKTFPNHAFKIDSNATVLTVHKYTNSGVGGIGTLSKFSSVIVLTSCMIFISY